MEIFTNHNRKPSLTGWQSHQSLFQRTRNRNTLFRKGTRLGIIMLVIVLGIYSLIQGFGWMIASGQGASETAATTSANEVPGANDKQVAQQLLQEIPLHNLKDTTVQVTRQDTTLHLDTSIDPSLQDYMLGKLDRKNSRYIALVALDPVGGLSIG